MVTKTASRRALCVTLTILIAVTTVIAGEVHVSWNPSETATSYRLYRGTTSGEYLDSDGVGNTTETTADGLADCMTWFFAVTASNAAGESGYSNEDSSWPRAVLDSASPPVAEQGTQLNVVVSGTNFRDGDTIAISNPGVQIEALTVDSCHALSLTLTVAHDAPTGPADIMVTHPSGVMGTGTGLLTITNVVDDTPPTITNIQATEVDDTSAVITWSTDEPADSQVFYRKLGHTIYQTVSNADEVTDHAVPLTGLEPDTTYEFHVSSTDGADNTSTSLETTFTTNASLHTYIRFEAESGIIVGPVRVTDGNAVFNGAWIDTPAGLDQGTAADPIGTATYGVYVPSTGTWFLWVRMYAFDSSTDSWFESIDGTTRERIAASEYDQWVWVEGNAYTLDEGLHTVELAGREPETRADRVLLTNDPDFVPTELPDADITPPGAVQDFTAMPMNDWIDLTWANPADEDLARVVIRYRTDGQYPTSPADGLPVVDRPALPGAIELYSHDGGESEINYYYSAFAVDGAGNVSLAAHALGAVAGVPPRPQNVIVY